MSKLIDVFHIKNPFFKIFCVHTCQIVYSTKVNKIPQIMPKTAILSLISVKISPKTAVLSLKILKNAHFWLWHQD